MPVHQINLTSVKKGRNSRGSSLSEIAPMVWVLFVLLTFPLLNLATIGLRYTFVVTASRDACAAAAQAKAFENDTRNGDVSAKHTAEAVARRELGSFNGIKYDNVTTSIVITDLKTKRLTRQTTKLDNPADTSANLYNIEIVLAAQVNPLINYGTGLMPSVPGLSAPMKVAVVSERYCDYPQGLNQ